MPKSRAIVVIVPDQALNKSLAFALEADGFRVSSFSNLAAAGSALPESLCIIADEKALPKAKASPSELVAFARRTLLLLEDAETPHHDAMTVLTKPLSGADVLAAVARFLPPSPAYV